MNCLHYLRSLLLIITGCCTGCTLSTPAATLTGDQYLAHIVHSRAPVRSDNNIIVPVGARFTNIDHDRLELDFVAIGPFDLAREVANNISLQIMVNAEKCITLTLADGTAVPFKSVSSEWTKRTTAFPAPGGPYAAQYVADSQVILLYSASVITPNQFYEGEILNVAFLPSCLPTLLATLDMNINTTTFTFPIQRSVLISSVLTKSP